MEKRETKYRTRQSRGWFDNTGKIERRGGKQTNGVSGKILHAVNKTINCLVVFLLAYRLVNNFVTLLPSCIPSFDGAHLQSEQEDIHNASTNTQLWINKESWNSKYVPENDKQNVQLDYIDNTTAAYKIWNTLYEYWFVPENPLPLVTNERHFYIQFCSS